MKQAANICELFYPVKIKPFYFAAQEHGTSILIAARENIDQSIYSTELAERIAAESRKLRLAFTVASLWATGEQAKKFSEAEFVVMDLFQYFSSADISTSANRDLFAMRYGKAAYLCTNERGSTVATLLAGLRYEQDWWLDTERYGEQIVIAPQVNLERMSLAQLRFLAESQTEWLKTYDSYDRP